jgi:hypothetical protein
MNEDANELKQVLRLFLFRIAQVIDGVRPHVDHVGKCKVVVDLATLHRPEVEIEPLEVEDQIVRNVL